MPLPGQHDPDPLSPQLAHLRDRLGLSSVMAPLNERASDIGGAPAKLADLRSRGWAWFAGLETELRTLGAQAHERLHSAEGTRAALTAPLAPRLEKAAVLAASADPTARSDAKRELDAIDEALIGCERQIEQAMAAWTSAVDQALTHLRCGQEALTAFASAGFSLPHGEIPLLVYGATWLDDPDPPPGVLLFTNSRVRFERRDDRIVRRNRMGLSVERNIDRTLLLDEPPEGLLWTRDASTGFVVREPRIALGLSSGKTAALRLDQPVVAELLALCESWRRKDLTRFH